MVDSVKRKAADVEVEMRGAVILRGDEVPQLMQSVASGTSDMLKAASNPRQCGQVNS